MIFENYVLILRIVGTVFAMHNIPFILQIEMKFNDPFFGLAYADFDRNSACQILGKGELNVKLELPLKGCGTKQVWV